MPIKITNRKALARVDGGALDEFVSLDIEGKNEDHS
jgi:hypothetical protein